MYWVLRALSIDVGEGKVISSSIYNIYFIIGVPFVVVTGIYSNATWDFDVDAFIIVGGDKGFPGMLLHNLVSSAE